MVFICMVRRVVVGSLFGVWNLVFLLRLLCCVLGIVWLRLMVLMWRVRCIIRWCRGLRLWRGRFGCW